MTTIQHLSSVSSRRRRRPGRDRIRRRFAAGAVIATLPYSALKVAWLSGSRIGLSDPDFGTSTTMHVLNGLTLGLDAVALTLALVFFTGAPAPRWLVLPTMWVGYGLLGQIVMIIGPAVVVQSLIGQVGDGGTSTAPIADWVYAAVYTGFSGLGLCLLPAFAIYAWQRWGADRGWGDRLAGIRRGRMPLVPMAAAATLVVALVIRSAFADSALEALGPAVDAFIGVVAVAGIRSGVSGTPNRLRRAVPLVAVWTASGAWTAWGVYQLVLTTIPNDLVTEQVAAVDVVLAVAKIIGGAGLLLTVRRLAATDHES